MISANVFFIMLTTILLVLTYNTQLTNGKEEKRKNEEFVVFITRPGAKKDNNKFPIVNKGREIKLS